MNASNGRILERVERQLARQQGSRLGRRSNPLTPDGLERIVEVYGPGNFPVELFGEGFDWSLLRRLCPGPVVFFDLETLGLGDVPIFLFGGLTCLPPAEEAGAEFLKLELILASDAAAEVALLREGAALLDRSKVWVSFNGRSFDHPRLRKRAFRHEVVLPSPSLHVDLLLEVRRRWKGELPDCRLGTVERRLLRLERGAHDVPGREVPQRYLDFVATGERRWLDPVIDHNRRDLIAMIVLLAKLLSVDPSLLVDEEMVRGRGAEEQRSRGAEEQRS